MSRKVLLLNMLIVLFIVMALPAPAMAQPPPPPPNVILLLPFASGQTWEVNPDEPVHFVSWWFVCRASGLVNSWQSSFQVEMTGFQSGATTYPMLAPRETKKYWGPTFQQLDNNGDPIIEPGCHDHPDVVYGAIWDFPFDFEYSPCETWEVSATVTLKHQVTDLFDTVPADGHPDKYAPGLLYEWVGTLHAECSS